MQRRDFLRISTYAGGGMMIAFSPLAPLSAAVVVHEPGEFPARWPIGHFLAIDGEGRVTAQIVKHEMGQGVSTTFAAILAEEMGADWERVDVRFMSHTEAYSFSTGGSNSIKTWWTDVRKAGALGRNLLCQVAATRWSADVADCRAENHRVLHKDGRSFSFAELAQEASRNGFVRDWTQFLAAETALKPEAEFKLLGTSFPRKNVAQIVRGEYHYGLDHTPEDALTAVIVRCPDFRGALKSFDRESVADIPGVHALVPITGVPHSLTGMTYIVREGVAIVADSMWTALKARERLKVEWDVPPAAFADDASYDAHCVRRLQEPETATATEAGDWASLPAGAPTLDQTYIFPHQTHAMMEPLNATARVRGDDVELWCGHQAPRFIITETERHLGIPADRITVHCFPSGGGFGRRYYPDIGMEAIQVARAMPSRAVKVVWTREDELRYGMFHFQHNVRNRVWTDAHGRITAWQVNDIRGWGPENPWAFSYSVPRWKYHYLDGRKDAPLPSCAWRAVTGPGWGFAFESAVDEVAHALNVDPVEFRLRHIPEEGEMKLGPTASYSFARLRRVLQTAAQRAKWDSPLPAGHARGVAVTPYTDRGYCAHVVEVANDNGSLRVVRVTSVIDVGFVVDPDNARQQAVGSVIWGMNAALYGGVPAKNGVAQWSSFADNRIVRMSEVPQIDVHFLTDASLPPLGLGEIPVPAFAPALANAYFALTGRRVRRLPLPLQIPAATASTNEHRPQHDATEAAA